MMSNKNQILKLCGESIHPGEHLSLALPLPEIFSCAPLHLPIKIIHGKYEGPCLLVMAAMHGNELNGTEIINRLLAQKNLNKLKGTLIAIPVMNVYGLVTRSRYLPSGAELDKCFPGSKTGTLGARIAHLFIKEIFSKADMCIDLQTGQLNATNLPQIYVSEKDNQAKELAQYFNTPVISNLVCERGTLQLYAYRKQKPYMIYEAGGALRFDNQAIKTGLKGINNVLQKTGMLPHKKKKETTQKSFFADTNIWVRATTSGISHTELTLGTRVKKGQVLCTINDPFGATESAQIKSPEDGVLVGINDLPLVQEGEGLFQLATFSRPGHVASELQNWDQSPDAGTQ